LEENKQSVEVHRLKCGLCGFEGTPYALGAHLVKVHNLDLRSVIIGLKEESKRLNLDLREDLRALIRDLTGREPTPKPSYLTRLKTTVRKIKVSKAIKEAKVTPPPPTPKPALPPTPRAPPTPYRSPPAIPKITRPPVAPPPPKPTVPPTPPAPPISHEQLQTPPGETHPSEREKKKEGEEERGEKKYHALAYAIFGPFTDKLLPHTEDLRVKLRKAGMKISLRAYVSLMFMNSFIVMVATFIYLNLILKLFAFSSIQVTMLSLGFAFMSWAITFYMHYAYPSIKAASRKVAMDVELPYAVSYMAILSSAGVSPEKMFRALAELKIPAISQEARDIVRDIELFGYDVFTAIEEAIRRSPSEKFSEILEGMVATARSGGELRRYLIEEARRLMRLRRIESRRVTTSLATAAELYIAAAVFGPLVFVVLLSVMAMMGGTVLGLSPNILLMIVVYLLLPIVNAIMLLGIDIYTKG